MISLPFFRNPFSFGIAYGKIPRLPGLLTRCLFILLPYVNLCFYQKKMKKKKTKEKSVLKCYVNLWIWNVILGIQDFHDSHPVSRAYTHMLIYRSFYLSWSIYNLCAHDIGDSMGKWSQTFITNGGYHQYDWCDWLRNWVSGWMEWKFLQLLLSGIYNRIKQATSNWSAVTQHNLFRFRFWFLFFSFYSSFSLWF